MDFVFSNDLTTLDSYGNLEPATRALERLRSVGDFVRVPLSLLTAVQYCSRYRAAVNLNLRAQRSPTGNVVVGVAPARLIYRSITKELERLQRGQWYEEICDPGRISSLYASRICKAMFVRTGDRFLYTLHPNDNRRVGYLRAFPRHDDTDKIFRVCGETVPVVKPFSLSARMYARSPEFIADIIAGLRAGTPWPLHYGEALPTKILLALCEKVPGYTVEPQRPFRLMCGPSETELRPLDTYVVGDYIWMTRK